jgi:hypothetical protein
MRRATFIEQSSPVALHGREAGGFKVDDYPFAHPFFSSYPQGWLPVFDAGRTLLSLAGSRGC